jgi:hypothetical protein
MSDTLIDIGTLTYGDFTILPSQDDTYEENGDLFVSGSTRFTGSTTSMVGDLDVIGDATMASALNVTETSVFDASVIFNDSIAITGSVVLTNTEDAINATSGGSLRITGGVGISRSTYLGKTLNVSDATWMRGMLHVEKESIFASNVHVADTTDSMNYGSGALIVAGGLNIAGNIHGGAGSLWLSENHIFNLNTNLYLNSPTNDLFINDAGNHDVIVNGNSQSKVQVNEVLDISTIGLRVGIDANSNGISDGAIVVAGGAAIGKTLNVDGDVNALDRNLTIGSLLMIANTQSVSSATGSFTTAGGFAAAKNLIIGDVLDVSGSKSDIGSIRFQSAYDGTSNWVHSGDVNRTSGDWMSLKISPLDSTDSIISIGSETVSIDVSTVATDVSSGSLVVNGGIGISGDLHVDLTAHFANTIFEDAVWCNNNHVYLGQYDDQTAGLGYYDTQNVILYGPTGGQLGHSNEMTNAILGWNMDQSVQIHASQDATSSATGALSVSGGTGIEKSMWIGGTLNVQNALWRSTDGNDITIGAKEESALSSIHIRNASDSLSGAFEIGTTMFNFHTVDIHDPDYVESFACVVIDKTVGHVDIRQTHDTVGEHTGSLQVHGGTSISKALWVGGNTTIVGNLAISGSVATTGDHPVVYSNTADSTSIDTGSLVLAGGLGVAKSVYVGGRWVVTDTTQSYDTTSGAVVVGGGLGIQSNFHVGGAKKAKDITVTGQISGPSATFHHTLASDNVSTGTVVVSGGMGIGMEMYVGEVARFTNDAPSTTTATGSIVTTGGMGVSGAMYVGQGLRVHDDTEAISESTGSILTMGGVGIGRHLYVDGDTMINGSLTVANDIHSSGTVTFNNDAEFMGGIGIVKSLYIGSTDDSHDPTTGSVVVSGGLGVAKSISIGGNYNLSGTNPLLTIDSLGLEFPNSNLRSSGTRIVLHSITDGDNTIDYAIGVETDTLWQTVPKLNETVTSHFKWYAGDAVVMSLDDHGDMILYGTTDATSFATGALRVTGGMGIRDSAFVGTLMNVSQTGYFGAAVTANSEFTTHGLLTVTNSTDSLTPSVGSIRTTGGLGVALTTNIGQNLGIAGDANITGDLVSAGIITSNSITNSTHSQNGSAVFAGGVGIVKTLNLEGDLNVTGSTTMNGDLYINGARTEFASQVVAIADNVVLLNSGPSGSASSGVGVKRFQFANDAAEGDVVTYDSPEIIGTVQAEPFADLEVIDTDLVIVSSTNAIILDSSASSIDGWYNGAWILITDGTGVGQTRRIKSYHGTERLALIYTNEDQSETGVTPIEGMDWTTPPTVGSTYAIFTSQYVLTVWDELHKEYKIGSSAVNPVSAPTVPIRNRIQMHTGGLRLKDDLQVDTVGEYTTGDGTTIENVLYKSGTLSGITNINNNSLSITDEVTLSDSGEDQIVIPGTDTSGSYLILVSDISDHGSSAIFLITGSLGKGGSVFRATSTSGTKDEHLTIVWMPDDRPRLRFMQPPSNPDGTNYTYRIQTTLP